VSVRSFAQRARELVTRTLGEVDEPEVERILVADAVVSREGDHYRIVSGGESLQELEAAQTRPAGACDCGGPLSSFFERQRCRSCGREYRA
jgi:hypothetical protein